VEARYVATRYPKPSVDGGGGDALTDGRAYRVLELGADPDRRNWFRVECDDGTPALFDSRCFVLLDNELPSTWQIELLDNGSVTIGPPQFLRRGFWEAFFDRDPSAEAEYADVVGRPRRWS
jgi:hypothetical protein